MLYEFKTVMQMPDAGNPDKVKTVKGHFITDAEFFSECENMGLEMTEGAGDVTAIYRSPIREIVNEREDGDKAFRAKVVDVMEIDGKEKQMNYYLLVFAKDLKDATTRTLDYLRQGYSMELDSISKSGISAFVKCETTRAGC